MENFSDIFKKGFLEMEIQALTLSSISLALGVSFLCGFAIFIFYKTFYRGLIYSQSFNILLVMTTMTTTFVILTISSNIVLSLGMVGALSIVRFRAAIKDPLDVGFIFLSVAAGIASGAGLYLFAIVATLAIGLVFSGLSMFKLNTSTYLLIVEFEDSVTEQVIKALNNFKYTLRNRTSSLGRSEITVQIRIKHKNTSFVRSISSIKGVGRAVLVQFDGDYTE
jgi:uncharacterized membrane protein YhiD involved in acid resistance